MDSAKDRIQNALLLLMKRKRLNDISIAEIIRTAGISRTAYYYYYYRQHEVLDDILNNIFEEMLAGTANSENETDARKRMVENLIQHQQTLQILFANTAEPIVKERWIEFLEQPSREWCWKQHMDERYVPAMAKHLAIGRYETIRDWILQDPPLPVEDFLTFLTAIDENAACLVKSKTLMFGHN